MKILLHNEYKIINLRYPTYMYQLVICLIITKIECWPVFKQDPHIKLLPYLHCRSDKKSKMFLKNKKFYSKINFHSKIFSFYFSF